MSIETILTRTIPSLPDVLANLIGAYHGKKYVKIEEPSGWVKAKNIFDKNPLVEALRSENIEQAAHAIQRHGWTDDVYPIMVTLVEQEKWKSIEFIFAQSIPNDRALTGYEDGPGKSSLNLGLHCSDLDFRTEGYFNTYTNLRFTWVIVNNYSTKHPRCFVDLQSYSKEYFELYGFKDSSSPKYFKLLDIWKTYHPLTTLSTYNAYDGSLLFNAAVRSSRPDYTIVYIFFKNGLLPQSCFITYSPKEIEQIGENGIVCRIHLAAWSAIQIYNHDKSTASYPIMVKVWLKAGLSPNINVIDEPNGNKVTWLMTMLCNQNLKGAELLLKAGANPNIASKPLKDDWNGGYLLFIEPNTNPVLPLKYARDQGNQPMVELLQQHDAHEG